MPIRRTSTTGADTRAARSGFCTGTGDFITVARCYNDANPSNVLAKYWGTRNANWVAQNRAHLLQRRLLHDRRQPGDHDAQLDSLAAGSQFPNTDPNSSIGADWATAAADPVFNVVPGLDRRTPSISRPLALYHANQLNLSAALDRRVPLRHGAQLRRAGRVRPPGHGVAPHAGRRGLPGDVRHGAPERPLGH